MNEKHLFIVVGILVLGFVGFMVMDSGSRPDYSTHAIDESIPVSAGSGAPAAGTLQVVSLHASASGYDNPQLRVKAGSPVRLDFSADSSAGCGRQLLMRDFGVNLVSRNGETVSASFTPPAPGEYRFSCSMNMFRGVLVAT